MIEAEKVAINKKRKKHKWGGEQPIGGGRERMSRASKLAIAALSGLVLYLQSKYMSPGMLTLLDSLLVSVGGYAAISRKWGRLNPEVKFTGHRRKFTDIDPKEVQKKLGAALVPHKHSIDG